MNLIGITECGDPAVDNGWEEWVVAGNPTILITKDPRKLLSRLLLLESLDTKNIIIHCTITGYGSTPMEPGAPHPTDALNAMKVLHDVLGHGRILLRVDPIIPTSDGMRVAHRVIRGALNRMPDLTRVRISFLDNYKHNHHRWTNRGHTPPEGPFHASLHVRLGCLAELRTTYPSISFEVCGEPGIPCVGCVGPDEVHLLGVNSTNEKSPQRGACNCLALKKQLITRRKPCIHNCVYCYWKD